MGTDDQFFRHPAHRLRCVSLQQGPQILVLDYYRSTTSKLIFGAKISGTKFRQPTSNSAFIINTIIAKSLVNFSGCFGSALVQFEFVRYRKNKQKINVMKAEYKNMLKYFTENILGNQNFKTRTQPPACTLRKLLEVKKYLDNMYNNNIKKDAI